MDDPFSLVGTNRDFRQLTGFVERLVGLRKLCPNRMVTAHTA